MFRSNQNRWKDRRPFFSAAGPVEYVIAGLGNPGKQYENTRHNVGFMAMDFITDRLGISLKRLKFQSLCGDGVLAGKRVLLLKPSTYMNRSGEAVRDALAYYKIPTTRLLVINDDIALDVGRMRIRRSGSDGGQKGLKNIIYLTGKDDFPRIRIGIGGKPHPDMELAAWVLSRFSPAEQKQIRPLFENTLDAVELILQGDIAEAMNRYN